MAERVQQLASENLPWRRGLGWPVVALEGLVLLAIGLFMLIAPDNARNVTRQLLAAILLVLSLLQVYGGFRNPTHPRTPFHILRGGIGATVGVIVLLEPLSNYLEPQASRVILAVGWLAYGLIGLVNAVATRGEQGIRVGALISSGIAIVLAITLLTAGGDSSGRLAVLGWIAVVGGVLLLAFAYYLFRRQTQPAAAATPAP